MCAGVCVCELMHVPKCTGGYQLQYISLVCLSRQAQDPHVWSDEAFETVHQRSTQGLVATMLPTLLQSAHWSSLTMYRKFETIDRDGFFCVSHHPAELCKKS